MTREEASLLVVGPDRDVTSNFASSLVGRPLSSVASQHSWEISTKYYDASITVHVISMDDALDREPAGCIMVVDQEDLSTMPRVAGWWEDNAVSSDAVRLLAVLGASEDDSALQESRLWCIDKMIEQVPVPEWQHAEVDPESAPVSEGTARIREALEAHMWPGMKLKTPQRGGAAGQSALPALASRGVGLTHPGPSHNPFLDNVAGHEGDSEDEPELGQLEQAFRAASGERASFSFQMRAGV